MLSIPPLIIAMAYLLLVVVGAVGALLLLIWLFGETRGETGTWRKTMTNTRNAKFESEGMPSVPTEVELREDRAA